MNHKLLAISAMAVLAIGVNAQTMDHTKCPLMGGTHEQGVDARGDKAMGFSHIATQHHFLLHDSGGAIQVVVHDPSDAKNLEAIRSHLKMIAGMFTEGNFKLPMFIHDTKVPGVDNMRRLRKDIVYRYEEIPNGGSVVIETRNTTAIAAVHNFLRFQIKDHRTGDPVTVSSK